MEQCTCPIRGYCERRKAHINPIHWQQCQDGKVAKVDSVYERIAEVRDTRVVEKERARADDPKRVERVARIKEAAARNARLKGWLVSLRKPEDVGLGDTAQRLFLIADKSREVKSALRRLLTQCSCQRGDAIKKLNAEFPYLDRENIIAP